MIFKSIDHLEWLLLLSSAMVVLSLSSAVVVLSLSGAVVVLSLSSAVVVLSFLCLWTDLHTIGGTLYRHDWDAIYLFVETSWTKEGEDGFWKGETM